MSDPASPPPASRPAADSPSRPAASSEPEDRKLRTRFALQALTLGDVFQSAFADYRLPGRVSRRVELSVPDGLSTAGGAQANQAISLVPEDPKAGILVAGHVNGAAFTAELRGYPYLNETHRFRFGRPLDFSAGAYQQFLGQAQKLLQTNGYTVTVVNQIPEATRQRLARQTGITSSNTGFWIVLLVLVLAGAGVVAYLLLAS